MQKKILIFTIPYFYIFTSTIVRIVPIRCCPPASPIVTCIRARRHQAQARAAEAGDESRVAQIAQLMSADPSLAEAATRVQVCAVCVCCVR